MTTESVPCYNKGCGQKFTFAENSETACIHHPGGPIFHDALKGWSCCKKRVSDFTEFLNIKGCTTGYHSNVKPLEPEKIEKPPVNSKEPMYQLDVKPQHRPPNPTLSERPSDDEPLVELPKTVGASLKTQLEKLSLIDPENTEVVNDKIIKIGTSCNNKGCKATYDGEHSNEEPCIFHPGVPIFHEGMKYWTCCQRKTSDFEAFLNQEGCESGLHNFHKPKVTEEKQVRVDWHQTTSIVCISIFAKVALPEKTVIQANRVKCKVSILYEGGTSVYEKTFVLREAIDPGKSSVKLLGTKIEIDLKKAEAFSWPTLEQPEPVITSSS